MVHRHSSSSLEEAGNMIGSGEWLPYMPLVPKLTHTHDLWLAVVLSTLEIGFSNTSVEIGFSNTVLI